MDQDCTGTVLLVDDNPVNLKFLLEILERENLRVTIAKSGEDALKKLERSLPDLILLDIQMPGLSGFETCHKIKENTLTAPIPVIFMTALNAIEDKVKGLKAGAVDYITKPFNQDEVIARIDVHIRLRKTQIQLLQSSKQAAVGQLAAGIAHEINNPVNFIYGNLHHVKEYTENLFKLLSLYENQLDSNIEINSPIEKFREEMELDFIRTDMLSIVRSMSNGAERIRSMVLSLNHFSRFNESEWKEVQVNEGVSSTLMLVSDRLRPQTSKSPEIEVVQHYGALPLIACYPALINDVLMHLILNAIEAIEERLSQSGRIESTFQPRLMLTTQVKQQQVVIQIQDNGVGIPLEVQSRMFNQFYTTKKVGSGMGLGLAIAQQVIEKKHKGQLTCESQVGQGSTFTIQLPILGVA